MTLALQKTELYEELNNPNNPAFKYISDERLIRDIWNIRQDLPSLASEAQIKGRQNIDFKKISLPWLKEFTKIAILVAVASQRWSLMKTISIVLVVNNLNNWFLEKGYCTGSTFTINNLQQWGYENNNSSLKLKEIASLINILKNIGCINFEFKYTKKPVKKNSTIIPEDVKYKIDLALSQLDPPISLIFKCQEALGLRSIEIAKIPLDCLRYRKGVYKVRLHTGKQNDSFQEQDLPEELVPLIREQQTLIKENFGNNFPWLFVQWQTKREGQYRQGWPPIFEYYPSQMLQGNVKLNRLLKRLIEQNDIRTKDGKLAHITTHMFRRTYATVAHRMGKRPDQIQHGLRHLNLDMQDSYVNNSPQEQAKQTERVLVDKDGKTTVYRTDKDRDFVGKEWKARQVEVGVCSRPSIQVACEYEYVCLGCNFVRYAPEHLPQLLEWRANNHQLLERCIDEGKSDSRRANSARQLIAILNSIIGKLEI